MLLCNTVLARGHHTRKNRVNSNTPHIHFICVMHIRGGFNLSLEKRGRIGMCKHGCPLNEEIENYCSLFAFLLIPRACNVQRKNKS